MHVSRSRLAFLFFLALSVALGLAAGAKAEQPSWYGKPGIVGAARVGATLKGDLGSVTCLPACEFGREWLSCSGASLGGIDPPGEPSPRGPGCVVRWASPGPETYTVGPEDQGRFIQFHVIAKNISCDEEDVCVDVHTHGYSPTFGPVGPALPPPDVLPSNAVPPAISGQAEDMARLSATPGIWTGTAPITLTYQWMRCPALAEDCQTIDGATASTYEVARSDIGRRLAVTVTATNRAGARSATATLKVRVAPARPRPGHDALQIGELLPSDRLVVKSVEGPRVIGSPSAYFRVTIADRRGFLIEGAVVRLSGGAFVTARKTTSDRGVALVLVKLRSFAAAPSRLVLTITASKPGGGEPVGTKRIALRVAR